MRTGIVTISDGVAAGAREDRSGDRLAELAEASGWKVERRLVIPDELETIADTLAELADREEVDLVLTTGGTGLGPRDVTPEATDQIIHRAVPGLPEAMRRETARITDRAVLSRAVAGIRGRTLIVNLPGSPKAVQECFEVIVGVLDHAVAVLHGASHGDGDGPDHGPTEHQVE